MAAWRRAIELSLGDAEVERLRSIAQSRTEPASRVERARIVLAYREDPSFFAVGRALGLHHQTVQRCVERAVVEGPMAALDDRPRPGKEPTITIEAKAWLTLLACRKAKDLGYPHELWTTRLLARHAREHGPAQGHACLANLAQGTVCKILDQEEVKPHKVRYYLEQRDPEFAEKMAEVLCDSQARLLAQPRRRLLLQAGPLRPAPHPCLLQTGAQAAPHGRGRLLQPRSSRSHMDLQARQGRLI
jgi:transposase